MSQSAPSSPDAKTAKRVRVMKFGGSVLTSAANVLAAASHAAQAARTDRITVIVSALRGVTDRLYSVTRALRMRDTSTALAEADEISKLHAYVGKQLFADVEQEFQFRLVTARDDGPSSVLR